MDSLRHPHVGIYIVPILGPRPKIPNTRVVPTIAAVFLRRRLATLVGEPRASAAGAKAEGFLFPRFPQRSAQEKAWGFSATWRNLPYPTSQKWHPAGGVSGADNAGLRRWRWSWPRRIGVSRRLPQFSASPFATVLCFTALPSTGYLLRTRTNHIRLRRDAATLPSWAQAPRRLPLRRRRARGCSPPRRSGRCCSRRPRCRA